MNRIFSDYVYGAGPRAGCFWDTTHDRPEMPVLVSDAKCDVVVVGAGFTGLNAAIALARAGRDVIILDENQPGWGASGRNGGFCCLGGGKLSDAQLDDRFSKNDRLAWRRAEKAAIEHVAEFLKSGGIDVDRHSDGETWLAHRARDMAGVDREAREIETNYGVRPVVHSAQDLDAMGLSAGFFGGMTVPLGFALDPGKYLSGLLATALALGVRIFGESAANSLVSDDPGYRAVVRGHSVKAAQVLIATNGYSSDNLPGWLSGRYLPVQSSALVTRHLSPAELAEQGWSSGQMCYDSRHLLHYFRLMPNGQMLFGMRGGLFASRASEKRSRSRLTKDFRKMFPAWADVEIPHYWSGMVSISPSLLPVVGEIPGFAGVYCAMNYHGNGVAMGSFCGHVIAQLMSGKACRAWPDFLSASSQRFQLGRYRRAMLWPAYAAFMLRDL